MLDEGVLLLEPVPTKPQRRSTCCCRGIHGNETAPIEMLDRLLQRTGQRRSEQPGSAGAADSATRRPCVPASVIWTTT
ncbi:MAG: hypothetical protein U1F55_03225 [Chitinivorax sp.]